MQIIKAKDRFHLEGDWLSAYWLFSFDRYYDPNNPSSAGLTPSYEQKQFTTEQRTGVLLPIASGQDAPEVSSGPVRVHQDVTFYVSRLRAGDSVAHELKPGRRAFFYVIDGEVTLNSEKLSAGDQARGAGVGKLEIAGTREGEVILIDLP